MPKGYSVIKRGNVYFLYHRKNLDGKLVGMSLRTDELRDAHRKAKQKIIELECELALARKRAEQGVKNVDDMTEEEVQAWVAASFAKMGKNMAVHDRRQAEEIRRQRHEEEERQRREAQEKALDEVNPRADAFWFDARGESGRPARGSCPCLSG